MKKLLIMIIVLALGLGCQKAAQEGSKSKADGNYLAKVNGVPLTEEDVKKELGSLPPQVRTIFLSEGGVESFVEELVKKELLYQEAKKQGIDKSEKLAKKLEEFKKLMMIEILLEEAVEKKTEVSEKEARQYYEKNKQDFVIDRQGKKETIDFERIKGLIAEKLSQEKQKEVFDSYIASLKNSNSVEINKTAIEALSKKTETEKEKDSKEK